MGWAGVFPSHKGYASKNLIKIFTSRNWESECDPFILLTFLMCQKVFLYVWINEKQNVLVKSR